MPLARVLRWIGISLGGMVGALCVAVLVFALIGRARLNRSHALAPGLTAVPGDSAALARGQHILQIHGCQECHGEDLRGQVFLHIPLGRIVAPNLTRGRGGAGATYHAEDWAHAVRFGVRPDHTRPRSGHAVPPLQPSQRCGCRRAHAYLQTLRGT